MAERGADRVTVGQARALLAAMDADTSRRLAADPAALKDFLRNVLIQHAVLAQAQAEKWDQRPEVVTMLAHAHDQLVAQTYLASHAAPPAGYPSESELQAAYEQNKSQFMQPRQYKLMQLFTVKAAGTSKASPDDGRRRLATLRAQIDHAHLVFGDAARRSTGVQFQDMGWVSEKQLVPAVRDEVAGLQEGAMSEIVCGGDACHLIKLIATRPAAPASLADVHDALVRALRQQKQAELERAYASGLLAKQPVAINEIELQHLAK